MQTEELVHHSFNRAQKYELERLTAIKSVFGTYTSTLASLNSPLQHSSERTALLQEAFVPSSDLNSIIERYRTGPFRPKPNVWVDWYHEATDVRFGLDLRHWRDTNEQSKKLPELIPAILGVIEEGYPKLPSDDGKYTSLSCSGYEKLIVLPLFRNPRAPQDLDIRCAIAVYTQIAEHHQLRFFPCSCRRHQALRLARSG